MRKLIQVVDRAIERQIQPTPKYPFHIELERSIYCEDNIRKSEAIVEGERQKEAELRKRLVSQMALLAYVANCAHEKSCDDESIGVFYMALIAMQEAEKAYDDCRSNIALSEIEIRDAYRVLNNPEYWSDEATAQLDARKVASRG